MRQPNEPVICDDGYVLPAVDFVIGGVTAGTAIAALASTPTEPSDFGPVDEDDALSAIAITMGVWAVLELYSGFTGHKKVMECRRAKLEQDATGRPAESAPREVRE